MDRRFGADGAALRVGSRTTAPGTGDVGLNLPDALAPRFELTSLHYESLTAEPVLAMDCQAGLMAVLSATGTLQVVSVQEDSLLLRARVRNPHRVSIDPLGAYVLATARDGEVHLYAMDTEQLVASVALQPPGASAAPLAALTSMLRGSVHVGECVCWLPPETAASHGKNASGTADAVNVLIGSRKGGMVFLVRALVPPPSAAGSRAGKATVVSALQLPDLLAGGPAHVPVASVFYAVVDGPATASAPPPTRAFATLFIATPRQLYRAAVPVEDARTPAALLARLSDGGATFDVCTVPPAPSPTPAVGDAAAWTGYGGLSVFASRADTAPRAFAWCSTAGILHGRLGPAPPPPLDASEAALFNEPGSTTSPARPWEDQPMITFQSHPVGREPGDGVGPTGPPLYMALTAFHMVLVYPQRCLVLHHPAGLPWESHDGASPTAVAARIRFDPLRGRAHLDPLLGVARDAGERVVYLFSESRVWALHMEHEHHQQWRLFLQRAMDPGLGLATRRRLFDAAYGLCRFDDEQRNVVQYLRGAFYLAAGAHHRATAVLADCDMVEAVATRLLLPHPDGPTLLVAYLSRRFELLARYRAAPTPEVDRQQCEALVALAGTAIGLLTPQPATRSNGEGPRDGGGPPAFTTAPGSLADGNSSSSLRAFLSHVAVACEAALPPERRAVVLDLLLRLLADEGRGAEGVHLAERTGRYHYVAAHHLAAGDDRRALDVLARHTAGRPEMAAVWYREARRLLRTAPVATVTAALKVFSRDAQAGRAPPTLRLERLLPALGGYRVEDNEVAGTDEHQVAVLLEQCILHFDCVSGAVHDFYVALLAELQDTDRLEEVLEASLFFDPRAALRACLAHRCLPAAVTLYRRLGLYEDAVLTAVQLSVPPPPAAVTEAWPGLVAAKELLRGLRADLDGEAYQRLWRILAEFAAARGASARLSLAIVDDSDGVLQLADVLGGVTDGLVVQDFKEAICSSLERYTDTVAQLRARQEEAYATTEEVKRELGDLRARAGYVAAKQRCPLCHRALLAGAQPVLIYPTCRHVVHEACAVRLLESMGGLDAFLTDDGAAPHLLEGVRSLPELAQADCVVCGEAVIVQTDIPLCEEDPSWALA